MHSHAKDVAFGAGESVAEIDRIRAHAEASNLLPGRLGAGSEVSLSDENGSECNV